MFKIWNLLFSFDFGGVCMLYISTVIPPWNLLVDFLCIGSYMYVLLLHKQVLFNEICIVIY